MQDRNEKPMFYAQCLHTNSLATKTKNGRPVPQEVTDYATRQLGSFLTVGKIYPAVIEATNPFKSIRLLRMDRKRVPMRGRQQRIGFGQGVFSRTRFKLITLEEYHGK